MTGLPQSPTDDELVGAVQIGDLEAFGRLYDRYSVRALRIARVACGDADAAERAVQRGFLDVWRRRSEFTTGRGDVADWLLDVLRTGVMSICTELENGRREPDELSADDLKAVEQLLTRLPANRRETLADALFGGLSPTATHGDLALGEGIYGDDSVARERARFARRRSGSGDLPEAD